MADISYFPYETLRPNQREFMELVSEAVRDGSSVVVEAPTGFGKTIATLAAVLPVAKERGLKIVYLARTHRQMDRVIEELKEINRRSRVSGVELRSRKELCLHNYLTSFVSDAYSAMLVCKNLKKLGKCKFYENEKKPGFKEVVRMFAEDPSHPNEVLSYAEVLEVCPYDLTRKIAENADVIVASYLYMLSPAIRNAFMEGIGLSYEDTVVIFDEAHNLPDQAISALSDRMSIHTINRAIKEALEYREEDIASFLSVLGRGLELLFQEKLRDRKNDEAPIAGEDALRHVAAVTGMGQRALSRFLNGLVDVGNAIREDRIEKGKAPRSYVGRVGEFFLEWLKAIGREDYLFLLTREGGISLELLALDPSKAIEWVREVHSAVFMSGTLSPLTAFRDVMGIENARLKRFPRIVRRENALVLVARDVSTRGAERSMESYRRMANYIVEAVRIIPKNVGVFAASYEVLQGLLSTNVQLRIENTGKAVFVEKRGATSKANDEMVKRFKAAAKGRGAVLMGVMGGRNSEGQDYTGDEMNGVILVGLPYARPTPRVEAQVRYFESKFPGKGRHYGYYLPAHRKLAQAAGRVHRSADERGVIVILDYRALWRNVRADLPGWMVEAMKGVNLESMRRTLRAFWGGSSTGR
ncbi:MAG: DEAD/DEAH box helicase [Thermococci archaeon]|nr:DEAD/DEAH box helicase [Thermococci archaeon]